MADDWFAANPPPPQDWFAANPPMPASSGTGTLIATATTAAHAAPHLAQAAETFATSPVAAKTVGAITRGATMLGTVAHGLTSGNLSEVLSAPVVGWGAGKGGYWLTQHAQTLVAPLADALNKITPYLTKAAPYLDLASASQAEASVGQKLNAFADAMQYLIDVKGLTPSAALKQVSGGDATLFGPLMTAYMRGRGVSQ